MPGPRRSALAKSEWIVRGGLALLAAGLGWVSVTAALGDAIRLNLPARAHALSPGNARITALLAQRLSGPDATPADRASAARLAHEALRRDPTAVPAVVTLGIGAQLRSDAVLARRLFAYSQLLSRRDLPTQLWAVEYAVARGDIDDALRHYDIALRTNRAAQELMFPVLASAITQVDVRDALMRTLRHKPGWMMAFIDYVANNGPDPRATMLFFQSMQRVDAGVPRAAKIAVIDALLARQMVAEAWSYYASIRPGVDRRRSRDPDVDEASDEPTAFDWKVVGEGGVVADINRKDGFVEFSAPASVGGSVLQQLEYLPAGAYSLSGRSGSGDAAEHASAYWSLTCTDGREIGRVELPTSSPDPQDFQARLSVPTGCPVQMLTLQIRPSDAVIGAVGRLYRSGIKPVE